MPKIASPALQSHGLHPFWGCLWPLEFAKSMRKMYFLFMDPLWRLCLPLCVLPHAFCMTLFTIPQCFRHHFAEKWTLLSELTSHKYVRLTLPARYIVFTCRHNVVLLESPALNCMLCFAALKLLCRSEIEGRRCCPPQTAFNIGRHSLKSRAHVDTEEVGFYIPRRLRTNKLQACFGAVP